MLMRTTEYKKYIMFTGKIYLIVFLSRKKTN